jgi:hypothetical protein
MREWFDPALIAELNPHRGDKLIERNDTFPEYCVDKEQLLLDK